MRLLCRIGVHSWRNAIVAERPMEYCSATVEGDKCRHCGKLRDSWDEITRLLPESHKWQPTNVGE